MLANSLCEQSGAGKAMAFGEAVDIRQQGLGQGDVHPHGTDRLLKPDEDTRDLIYLRIMGDSIQR